MSSIDNYNKWPFFCAVKKFVPRSGGVDIDDVAYNSRNASKLNFGEVVVLSEQSADTVRKQMTVSLNGGTPIIVRCCYNKTCPRVVNWVVFFISSG